MAENYIDIENIRFGLEEVLNLDPILAYPKFQDFDQESINMMLDTFKNFADKALFPYLVPMDEKPVYWEDGQIYAHPQVEHINKGLGEMGWFGATFDYEYNGMQLPQTVYRAIDIIMSAANNSATGYATLTTGAARLIIHFANQELKNTYVPKMASGEWMGTMCLTEPQAGSSLSDIKTSAVLNEDGSYAIKGTKIFISGGDHQFSDNFIHLTLARLEGAPAGTKGISLFVVPKNRPTSGGGLEYNDVESVGEFKKVGQQGFATVHLDFGTNDNCKGWLVGEEGRGLQYMFMMMNGARIGTGVMGAGIASAAYHASLQYANERSQGRKMNKQGLKDATSEPLPIINHADVRRMLLKQKAITEGAISLILTCSHLFDLEEISEGKEKENADLLMELLTPVVKTYPAEQGLDSVNNGLQILGGYGFCMDFPLQQYYRDIRIMSLYEGTTGIQSQDLLGRKMTIANGKAVKLLTAEITNTIQDAQTFDDLKSFARKLEKALSTYQRVMQYLMPFAIKGEHERFLADANIMMELFSTLVVGWQWLKMGVAAKKALVTGNLLRTREFYEGKLLTLRYFFKYEMTIIEANAMTLMDNDMATIVQEKELIA